LSEQDFDKTLGEGATSRQGDLMKHHRSFDADAFVRSIEPFFDALDALYDALGSSVSNDLTIYLPMEGPLLSHVTGRHLRLALEATEISAQDRAKAERIIDQMRTASERIRTEYLHGAGRFDPGLWAKNRLVVLAGPQRTVTHEIESLQDSESAPVHCRFSGERDEIVALGRRLHLHARLDLVGAQNLYSVTLEGQRGAPYAVRAPSPEGAIARVCALLDVKIDRVVGVKERIHIKTARDATNEMLERAGVSG